MRRYRRNLGTVHDLRAYLDSIRRFVPSDLMPKTLEALDARQLGCGSYGCAYRARRKGWVIKVTEDKAEALIAVLAASSRAAAASAGMVKFGGVVKLDPGGEYMIWREEAKRVGQIRKKDLVVEDLCAAYEDTMDHPHYFFHARDTPAADMKRVFKAMASPAYAAAMKAPIAEARAFRFSRPGGWSRGELADLVKRWASPECRVRNQYFDDYLRPRLGMRAEGVLSVVANLSEVQVKLVLIASALKQKVPVAAPAAGIVKTLEYFAKRGVYLYDLHDENMGYVKRGGKNTLVLTDARAVVTNPAPWKGVKIHIAEKAE